MIRFLAVTIGCLALAACSASVTPPQVTINPQTNTVTTAPTPNAGSGLAVALGNLAATDTAAAINLACGTPVKDSLGCNFFTDLVNLNKALNPQASASTDVGAEGALTLVERARIQLGNASNLGNNPLLVKTLIDGTLWVQDTKRKAIAIPAQIAGLLAQIQAMLLAP